MTARAERLAFAGMALGFVVLVVPIATSVASEIALWNHLLAGGAILLLTRYVTAEAGESQRRAAVASAATAGLGVWLVATAIAFPGGYAVAFWSKAVAGALVAAIGIGGVLSVRPLDRQAPAASP